MPAKKKYNDVALQAKPNLNKSYLKKYMGACFIENGLTVEAKKLINLLILNAQTTKADEDGFYIISRESMRVNCLYNLPPVGTARFKKLFNQLATVELIFDVIHEDGYNKLNWDSVEREETHEVRTYLHDFHIEKKQVRYQFNPEIEQILLKPKLYAKLDLEICNKFTCPVALTLWEAYSYIEEIYAEDADKPGFALFRMDEIQWNHLVFSNRKTNFSRNAKEDFVQKAVQQVNEVSDLKMVYRNTVDIVTSKPYRFWVQRKHYDQYFENKDQIEMSELLQEEYKLDRFTAKDLALNNTKDKIAGIIEELKDKIQESTTLRAVRSLIVKAVGKKKKTREKPQPSETCQKEAKNYSKSSKTSYKSHNTYEFKQRTQKSIKNEETQEAARASVQKLKEYSREIENEIKETEIISMNEYEKEMSPDKTLEIDRKVKDILLEEKKMKPGDHFYDSFYESCKIKLLKTKIRCSKIACEIRELFTGKIIRLLKDLNSAIKKIGFFIPYSDRPAIAKIASDFNFQLAKKII